MRVCSACTASEDAGKTSGLDLGQMESKGTDVWQIRDGEVVGLTIYYDRARAFADVGLAPEDALRRLIRAARPSNRRTPRRVLPDVRQA